MVKSMSKIISYAGLVLMIGALCIFVRPQPASAAIPASSSPAVLSSLEQYTLTDNLNNSPGAPIIVADDDEIEIEIDVDGEIDLDI
jgi:hypothetical protein